MASTATDGKRKRCGSSWTVCGKVFGNSSVLVSAKASGTTLEVGAIRTDGEIFD